MKKAGIGLSVLMLLSLSSLAQAEHYRGDVDVHVPPEVFDNRGNNSTPCNRCCIYENRNYSEGAVVKTDGVLLQCQRDEKALSTNPLVWRRVRT